MITRCYWTQLLRIIVALGFFDIFKKCWTQENFDITTPVILVHPESNNVSVIRGDESIELMCLAIGSNVTYSWERENSLLPNTASGQNTNILTLLDLRPSDNGNYRCRVSNTHGSTFSNYAYVNVTASMQAMVEPHNLMVEVTTSVQLSCVVNGFEMHNVSYVWEVSETGGGVEASWQHIATSSHLLLNNVTNSAVYRCIVTNSSGTIAISAISYITVVVHPPRIIAHPISKAVELYTSNSSANVSFSCNATGNSSRFQWERLQEALPANSQGETMDTLILYNVQPKDSGFYRCSVSNNSGTAYSEYAALNITVHPPNITVAYLNQSLYGAGDQAVFVCKGEGVGRLHFKWQRQSGNISPSAVVDVNTGILTIPDLSSSDKGKYRCIISDEWNGTVYSEYVQLNVAEGSLVINANSESMLVRRNSNANLSCVVIDQNINAIFLWSRVNGEPLSSRTHGSDSSVLTIVGVREEDEGEYTCTASTEHETLTATILLTVYDIPVIHQLRPQHVTEVSNELLLTCTAQNDPDSPHPLEITWYKGDTQLTDGQDGRYQITYLHGVDNVTITILTVSRVQKDDAGRYSCRVRPGDVSTETTVVVNYIPEIVTFQILPSSNATIGEAIQLLCRVDANPLPSVTVYRNNRVIFTTIRTVVDYQIQQVSADDDGTVFSCGAQNSLGTASQQHATLTVTGIPIVVPSTTTISPSSSSIINHSIGSSNILPSVVATSVSATPTSHPAPVPANVQQTSRGLTSVQIRWTASEEHILFHARVSCVAPCTSEDVRNFETMDTSLTVYGLKPGHIYTVQIAAVTDDGVRSEYSDPIQVSTAPTSDPNSVLFQLQLVSATACNEWKLDVVTATIVNEIVEHCACPLSTADVFSDTISCDNTGHVIYRAGLATSTQLDAEKIRTILNEWFAQTSMLSVDGSVLQVDQSCPLILSSFNDTICGSTSDMSPDVDSTSDQNVVPLLAGIVGGIIVGAVIITIMVVILVVKCRGKTDKIRPGGNTPVNGSLDVAQARPAGRTQTRSAGRKAQTSEEATYSEVFEHCELQSCPAYQASVYLDHDYADIEDNNNVTNSPDHVSAGQATPAQISSSNIHSHNELEVSMSSSSFGRCNGNDYSEPLTLNQRLDSKASRLVLAQMALNGCSDYIEPVSHKSASNSRLNNQDTVKSQSPHQQQQQQVPTEYLEPVSVKEPQEHFQQYDHLSSRTQITNIYSELN